MSDCNLLHVDMDSFFASVEVLDDPSLRGKPVIVGGSGTRGVVASCTYEARAYGIRSAMSSMQARRRCPDAIFVSGRYDRYSETSKRLHEILVGFTPMVEGIGLDEAFLDVSGTEGIFGSPPEVAWRIRAEVKERLRLDCSVGVARTKLIAKLASRAAKPRASLKGIEPGEGVVVVNAEDEKRFLHPKQVQELWGVGPSTAKQLAEVGVTTVGELANIEVDVLCRLLGSANGRHLAALARGEDERHVEPDRQTKSIGHEETFALDICSHEELHKHLVRMADAVSARLRESRFRARTVSLKVRFGDRRTISRSRTVGRPTASQRVLASVALSMLERIDVGEGVRLLGISASSLEQLVESNRQLSFDSRWEVSPGSDDTGSDPDTSEVPSSWEDIESAVAAIRVRFGQAAVAPAALVGPCGVDVKRRGDTQWGPRELGHDDAPGD